MVYKWKKNQGTDWVSKLTSISWDMVSWAISQPVWTSGTMEGDKVEGREKRGLLDPAAWYTGACERRALH